MPVQKKIVVGVTASIAIYKACDLVRRLRDAGYDVTVVMTPEAEELIRPIVFQSLSGNKVYRGLFEIPETWEIEHIALAEKAGLVLVAPATANIIGKIAGGICDDLLTCIIQATKAPVVLSPAMNDTMYLHPITQDNIKKLKRLGVRFVEPVQGKLACGKTGPGCLASVETIVEAVKKILR
ncbi:MAG TPA: flavoprotein [Candidatus Omnitrophota bacterium]|mgnify:CR=1 FL=1|nr:flavoprotein [Candidatus Omnitrophota bacterium]HPT07177.1 flavoprotein [Candidatus Omnitrophota bacterium]